MSTNLMEKLAISKAIMDKHNNINRGQVPSQSFNIQQPELQEFQAPTANYNIPQELMTETKSIPSNPQPASKDRILNSRLPDEIKKLMIENPITQVNPMSPSNSVLSDELVEKASKLMGTKRPQPQQQSQIQPQRQNVRDNDDLRQMMKEVVEEVLRENGLLMEKSSNTNESIAIKVGQHIFEGKISKIKKTK
jgi:hypothetical protein